MSNHYFLGIPVADALRETLNQAARSYLTAADYKRKTDARDYHITLLFLGALASEQRTAIVQAVHQTSTNWTPFTLALSGIDGFGDRRHPRVLFASLKETRGLTGLQAAIAQAVAPLGVRLENRPYHPHITLAKRWVSGDLPMQLPAVHHGLAGKQWTVSAVSLFQVCPGNLPNYQQICLFPFQSEKREYS
ncbi:RNA 2',3'-cyclic phosphodiesterase [Sporolactobacillus terrae]|uniref:RNA 2',3'-cyclic phosphodiesterase n=1 Tax=Sporolactobacillus terrae TaxID=269673 RepID=UPI00048E9B3F|nr:RNA 2',3'-cyclic phosphodiesterase [Sporolactobacillus terrae]